MQNLILLRHGETQRDKENSKRALTPAGKIQIRRRVAELAEILKSDVKILHTPTYRAMQTGAILKKYLKRSGVTSTTSPISARIYNLDNMRTAITQREKQGYRPTETYMKYYTSFPEVEAPSYFSKRIQTYLHQYINRFDIVLVSHEASLEAFLYYQENFKLISKTFNTYFEYSDFALLRKI